MKLKDLRSLLNEVPEGMSKEEFDNLEIMVYDDGTFESANPDTTGVMIMESEPQFENFDGQHQAHISMTVFCITNLEAEEAEHNSEEED